MLDKLRHARKGRWIPVALANLFVVVIATTLTAVLALVVEDLLPKHDPNALVVGFRWAVVAVLVGLLLLALLARGRIQQATGTLFHVQILDEAFADTRQAGAAEAVARKISSRSITRWVDLEHRRNPAGVIELAEVCEEVGAALEQQINDDGQTTGSTVAPNMLWPMALAVGGALPAPPEHRPQLRLVELATGPARGAGASPPRRRDPMVEMPLRHEPLHVEVLPQGELNGTGRFLVWLAFSSASQHHSWDTLTSRFGVSAGRIIHLGAPPQFGVEPVQLSKEQVAGLGPAIANELVSMRSEIGDAELVVVAMITKASALSAGWHLAQAKCRFFHNTFLMHYDEVRRDFVAMRVKESQPAFSPSSAQPVAPPRGATHA